MDISSISGLNFKQFYYSADCHTATNTQKDALQDLTSKIKDSGLVKRLEKIGWDVYMEPRSNDSYVVNMALLRHAKLSKEGHLFYDKIINMGGYILDVSSVRFAKKFKDVCTVDRVRDQFERFFEKYKKHWYNNRVNML